MQLLTQKLRRTLPPLYATENQGMNAIAQAKYFTPDSNWYWYAAEFDGEDLFFGLVAGHEIELGYFRLSELSSIRGPLGLAIERDLWWNPTSLKEIELVHKERGWL
ncbi:MAG: DUF2958 domain-containing protein [Anaerolineae bacterium]|nr:DUF2958 domain-containing protein [Anaerolineae bacterium]